MYQEELIEGLIRLADLSEFVNEGREADVLAENFRLIENPLDYFMRCLSVSRGLRASYENGNCPDETGTVSNILREAADCASEKWLVHRQECHVCNHQADVYAHLVRNIWRVLNSGEAYLFTSIILAYLRGDALEQIERIFMGLKELREDADEDTRFLKGILTVEQLDESGSVKNCWYGLVRREASFMGSTRCFMCPLGEESPIFRVDIDNDLERFYFQLFGGIRVEGGLRFYLDPHPDKLVFQPESFDFAQQMEGVCLSGENMKLENWRAGFYGRLTSPSMDVMKEYELRMNNW